ncbi:phospho-N-acetylmuramoyl-pentapeptide-transferase [Candidatus Uhrbacteria bacterium]|nr:phospho-N-acetylmuramoyl-pentapeptide-transferase [Candidatus Uhrbacteria bacterium]
MVLESFEIIRVLLMAAFSFLLALFWEPMLHRFLIRARLGKPIRDAAHAPVFAALHAAKAGTPTMGGILVWGTTLLLALAGTFLFWLSPDSLPARFSFLTRSGTLLPMGVLVASAIVGMVDDYLNVKKIGALWGGLRMRHRLMVYTLIAAVGAWWFSVKLDWDLLHVPFVGDFHIGLWYMLFFLVVIIATAFSVNQTDGLDGLAGGTLFIAFGAYALISFAQGRYDLAVFCGVIVGALLAFLWFNIYPAKFFMGDTGAMSLGITLGVVALLTNTALLLPIIGIIFVIESCTTLLQMASKKIRKKKIFLSSPIHHHLEAIGWKEPQIVMRAWVVALVFAAVGTSLALLDALM